MTGSYHGSMGEAETHEPSERIRTFEPSARELEVTHHHILRNLHPLIQKMY